MKYYIHLGTWAPMEYQPSHPQHLPLRHQCIRLPNPLHWECGCPFLSAVHQGRHSSLGMIYVRKGGVKKRAEVVKCVPHWMHWLVFSKPQVEPGLTLKGPGGGGGRIPPPLYVSWKKKSTPRAVITFFFQVLRNFWRYFRKNLAYGFQSYATLCNRTSAQNFKIFWIWCTKHMENGFLCRNSILSSKCSIWFHYSENQLFLLIFNTRTIPYKKTIKYISRKNKEIHKKFAKQ